MLHHPPVTIWCSRLQALDTEQQRRYFFEDHNPLLGLVERIEVGKHKAMASLVCEAFQLCFDASAILPASPEHGSSLPSRKP